AIPATAVLGMVLEVSVLRTLYARDHLSQVLATFALILIINELVRLVWGSDAALPMPAALSGPVELLPGLKYSSYRLVIIAVGVVDTIGRAFLPILLGTFFQPRVASAAGPALASVSIYLIMAIVLYFKPQGLFPARG